MGSYPSAFMRGRGFFEGKIVIAEVALHALPVMSVMSRVVRDGPVVVLAGAEGCQPPTALHRFLVLRFMFYVMTYAGWAPPPPPPLLLLLQRLPLLLLLARVR